MRIEYKIELAVPKGKVWQILLDIDRFIAYVPGCKEDRVIEEGKIYSATIVEKVGPFRVEFPIRIEIEQTEPLSYIKARASGSDNRIGSHMKVEMDVNLKESGSGSILSFVISVDILGKLATLGHSMIKRKADQVMGEFIKAVKERLEGNS